MRRLLFQCSVVFVMAFLADVIACVHIKTLVGNQILLSATTVTLLHYLGFLNMHWFTEHKDTLKRLLITTSAGLGAGLGTTIICLLSS